MERKKRKGDAQYLENLYIFDSDDYNADRKIRKKKVIASSCDYEDKNIKVSYDDLLRKIASDLKILKLNDRFHCSHNATMKTNILPHPIYLILFCCLIYVSL